MEAMSVVGVPQDVQDHYLTCIAVVLHIGNIKLTEKDADSTEVDGDSAERHLGKAMVTYPWTERGCFSSCLIHGSGAFVY